MIYYLFFKVFGNLIVSRVSVKQRRFGGRSDYSLKTFIMNQIIEIISNTRGLYWGNLRYYYQIVFASKGVNNPYHNFRHSMHVLCRSYEAAQHEGLDPISVRQLLIAAMFHDYNHSGVMGNDAREIQTALLALGDCLLSEDVSLYPEIMLLIKATEFPHSKCALSPGAAILRDADMSPIFSDVWLQQIIFGLAKEMGISALELLLKEEDFLRSMEFYSVWGNKFLKAQVPQRIKETKEFLKLLRQ